MKKSYLTGLTLLALIVTATIRVANAGQGDAPRYEKLDLAMSVNGTDIATDTKVANYFARMVKEASDGRIVISVFPNDQLAGGNATKGIEMVAVGAVDLAAYASSTMSVMDERLLVGTIPWVFDDYQHARRIIDGSGGEHYRRVLRDQGFVYLGSCHNGLRQITNSRREIRRPEDVAGLKIRVPGGEIFIRTFRAFGGDPVAMSWSEAFTAIQQGTIDGQENGFSVTNSAKVNEIQKYMTVWNYTYENYLFVANEAIFERFSPATQALLHEKALEACEWGRQLVEREEQEIEEKFVAAGMQVTHLTPEELSAFKAVVADLQGYLRNKYGAEACSAFGLE
ncbi:MAG: DctP family TRAP transporter solute-binding subunit [Planctomycetes bacterium]|nr:DctP family TRAP transporter solute-binding subunit [Planctomycetota bacterium]